jgi:hypothetical protein
MIDGKWITIGNPPGSPLTASHLLTTKQATVNQHPPAHHDGWWMNDKWSRISFLLGSTSLANHGGKVSSVAFFNYLPTNNPQASC